MSNIKEHEDAVVRIVKVCAMIAIMNFATGVTISFLKPEMLIIHLAQHWFFVSSLIFYAGIIATLVCLQCYEHYIKTRLATKRQRY